MKTPGRVVAVWLNVVGLALLVGIGCESVGLRSMRIYIQQKNWDKALAQGKVAVGENPGEYEAWFAIAQVSAQVDSFDLMLRAIEKTQSLTRKYDAEIKQILEAKYNQVFNQGVEKYNAGDLPTALERLDLAVTMNTARPDAYKVRGMVYQRTGHQAEAIESYRLAFEADTSDVEVGRQYASLLGNTGHKEQAREFTRMLYLANPGNKQIVLSYVLLLADERQYDAALAALQGALAQEPDDEQYNFRAGIIYMQKAQAADDTTALKNSLQAAIPHLERATALDTANADIAYNLAMCYRQLGRLDEALMPLQRILAANPGDNLSRLQLATIYLQENQIDSAEPHLHEIVDRIGEPTKAEDRQMLSRTFRYLGIIYTVRGNAIGEQARQWTEEAEAIKQRSRTQEKQAKLQRARELEEESSRLFRKGQEMDRMSREYGS